MTMVRPSPRLAETLFMIRDRGPLTWAGCRRSLAAIGSTMTAGTCERNVCKLKSEGLIARTAEGYAVTPAGAALAKRIETELRAHALAAKRTPGPRAPFRTYVKRSDRQGNPMRPVTLPFVSILGEGARV